MIDILFTVAAGAGCEAKRHDVVALSVDVTISSWDLPLKQHDDATRPAVRLGLSLLRGMRNGAAERIANAGAVSRFESVRHGASRPA